MFHFPGGLKDYLAATLGKEFTVTREIFSGRPEKTGGHGNLYAHVRVMLPEGGDPELESLMRHR